MWFDMTSEPVYVLKSERKCSCGEMEFELGGYCDDVVHCVSCGAIYWLGAKNPVARIVEENAKDK